MTAKRSGVVPAAPRSKRKPRPAPKTKRGRKPKLEIDPEIQETIVRSLRQFASPVAAAEAGGITYETFLNWMAWGEQERRAIYRKFFVACTLAMAEARTVAEGAVAVKNPEAWLKNVHRDKPGRPGWGDVIRVESDFVRREAEALAAKHGLSVDELVAMAERIVDEAG